MRRRVFSGHGGTPLTALDFSEWGVTPHVDIGTAKSGVPGWPASRRSEMALFGFVATRCCPWYVCRLHSAQPTLSDPSRSLANETSEKQVFASPRPVDHLDPFATRTFLGVPGGGRGVCGTSSQLAEVVFRGCQFGMLAAPPVVPSCSPHLQGSSGVEI